MAIFCPSSAFCVTFASKGIGGGGWTPLGRLLSNFDFVPVTRITSECSTPLPFASLLDLSFLKERDQRKVLTNYSIPKSAMSQASVLYPEESRVKELVEGGHITCRIGSWGCIWQLPGWDISKTHNCPCAGIYHGETRISNTHI